MNQKMAANQRVEELEQICITSCWDGSLSVIIDFGNQINQDRFEILSNQLQSVNESIHEKGIVFITKALSKS